MMVLGLKIGNIDILNQMKIKIDPYQLWIRKFMNFLYDYIHGDETDAEALVLTIKKEVKKKRK